MELDYFKSTGFRIKELKISTKNGTELDITQLYEELNIFDSIFQPCLNGNILIKDSSGLIHNLLLDGNEFLLVNIGKTNDDELSIKRIFRIYKLTNRKMVNMNSETYILHFISEEFIQSTVTRVCQSFGDKTLSEIALFILKDYMKAPDSKIKDGIFDPSLGVKKIVFPTLSPIKAITEVAKLAIDEKGTPGFLFFENLFGYNFASLRNLLERKSIFNINFNPKNLNTSGEVSDFLGVRHFEVLQQFDLLDNIEKGVYGGKYKAFDPQTHDYVEMLFTYDSINHPRNPENSAPSIGNIRTYDGSVMDSHFDASFIRGTTNLLADFDEGIREDDEDSSQKRIDYENIVFQRQAIFGLFSSQRVKLVVPGNFLLCSGNNVFLHVPKFSQKTPGEDNWDRTLYGSYMIVSSRHMIKPNGIHETIFEACTNSSNRSENNVMYDRNSYLNGDYNAA
jgi:hypothetical protein